MTKIVLLDMLKSCYYSSNPYSLLDGNRDVWEQKRKLVAEKYKLIDATLRFCPDEMQLEGFSCLDGISKKSELCEYLYSNDVTVIKSKFDAILTDINTLANRYIAKYADKVKNTATALASRNDWMNERQRNNHHIAFPIFISIFILFSLIVITFAVMDAMDMFTEGTNMNKLCKVVVTVAGAVDFINGLAFFIYERRDDKKKAHNQCELDKIVGNRVCQEKKNSGNDIRVGKGCKITIGDTLRTENESEADKTENLNAYIIKNSNNKIRAKKDCEVNIGDK